MEKWTIGGSVIRRLVCNKLTTAHSIGHYYQVLLCVLQVWLLQIF